MLDLFARYGYNITVEKNALDRLTPTALAFIGDAVYSLYIRTRVVSETDFTCGTTHVIATKYVNATAQAEVFDALSASGFLTPDETDIARRAKNAHLHTRSKIPSDTYHKSTALEAVIGYAELSGNAARNAELLDKCAEFAGLNKSN